MLFAGSLPATPKVTVGSSDEFFAQMSYCVKVPPRLRLCEPLSQLTVSSTSRLLALRDCGAALLVCGLVSCVPMLGNCIWNPFWFASDPVHMPVLSSPKKVTG